LDKQVD